MKNGLRHPAFFAALIMLSLGAEGCRARVSPDETADGQISENIRRASGEADWPGDISRASGEAGWPGDIPRASGEADWPGDISSAAGVAGGTGDISDAAEEASVQAREQGKSDKGKNGKQPEGGETQLSAAALTVTDHRAYGAMVREYGDREEFLREYGFGGEEPYFEYFSQDGALQLELFYDESAAVGCGLCYYTDEDREPEGFLFNGSNKFRFYRDFMESGGMEADRYSTLAFDGSDGKGEVRDYEESVLYREDGRLAHYDSQGWITYLTEKKEIQKLLQIDWTYREDGTLQEKDYWHNGMVFGTWHFSGQSYYDELERLVYERSYITHGSLDYYYIYKEEEKTPSYCLIIDNNLNLLCAELLEYCGMGTELYYGKTGPILSGEAENPYAAAVIEAAEKEGKDYGVFVTHTYAADYDGDYREEAFVVIGTEPEDEYGQAIIGDCWFVDSQLEASVCIDRAESFRRYQELICQDGGAYLLISYLEGRSMQTEIYTVENNLPVRTSDSRAYKYLTAQGQVIQIQNSYDGSCMVTNVGTKESGDDWRFLWTGHSWKPYTFDFDHGELHEIPAREVTREEAESIAPLPDSFDETAPEGVKQFILRENGELNINMAVEQGEEEKDIDFSYITYRLNENGEWEYAEEQMGYYLIQFSGESSWKYIDELYRRYDDRK